MNKHSSRPGLAGLPLVVERQRDRNAMLANQLVPRGISDPGVLAAMAAVPRHRFVPADLVSKAYADEPLPIGYGQTISQPFMVALMTGLLELRPGMRVLEVGTGCGYQTAILATLGVAIWTIEIIPALAERARVALAELGLGGVVTHRAGDGREGWPEQTPFDGIIVTAAPLRVVPAWAEQLRDGGRLVVPLGDRRDQWLHRFTKHGTQLCDEAILPVRFVPLVGSHAVADAVD